MTKEMEKQKEEQMLWSHLGDENKRGKFGPGITAQGEKQAGKHISQQIIASFPPLINMCEKV